MRPGWYILNYHNVDYEDSILTRALGGTTRPDVFVHHLETLAELGRFVSVPEGQRLLDSGEPITEPLFSLWFDDGYAGVREFALPICRDMGIVAALSICSRFVRRQELFWRCKLSYLAHADGLRFLRSRLRRSHRGVPMRLRTWTLRHFSPELLATIDEVYDELSTEAFRNDALCLFDTEEGLRELVGAGWTLANHSAAHYPLAPHLGWDAVEREFDECEALVRELDPDNRYWVVPFGYGSEHYMDRLQDRAVVVEVGEQRNTLDSWQTLGRLFRYSAPTTRDIRAVTG